MTKLKSNSDWLKLTPEQRLTAEKWLFHEQLGHDESSARIKAEFGVDISAASVGRYYRRRVAERQLAGLDETHDLATMFADSPAHIEEMRAASLKLLTRITFKLACDRPDQLKDLTALARILLLSEDNEIRRGWLKLKQNEFHYEAASAASEELPRLASLLQKIENNADLTPEAKSEKVQSLLFPQSTLLAARPQETSDTKKEN